MQPSLLHSWTRHSVTGLLLGSLVPAALSQTVSLDPEVCSLLDCSLATYILIGIAALYSILSLICIILICVACRCCKKRSRTKSKVQPQYGDTNLEDVFPSDSNHPLDTIPEASTEDFFVNEHATTGSDSEGKATSSSESSSSSEDSGGELDSSTLVTPNRSAKKRRKRKKQEKLKPGKSSLQTDRSPLQTHQPKGSPIPPRKVPVPFSGTPEDERGSQDRTPHPPPSRLPPIETEGTPRRRKLKPGAATENQNLGFSNPISLCQEQENEGSDKDTPASKKERRPSPAKPQQKSIGSPIDESTLKFEMVKVSHKWRKIGKAFSLSTSMLNNISIICSNNSDNCMLRICEEWLKLRKERDWIELVEILQSEEIDEKKLADYLQIYYYKPEHGLLQFDEELGKKSSEGNLSFYFKQHRVKGAPRDTEPPEEDDNDAEGSKTWL